MPEPKPGQTQDEFMSECIKMVMDDGTASSNDQAIAICESKWAGKSIDVTDLKIGAMISASNKRELMNAHDTIAGMLDMPCAMKSIDPDEMVMLGGEIKAIGEGKLGGYLVRHSTPDDTDLVKDYFDFTSQITAEAEIPTLYHHGLDKKMGRRVIGVTTTKRDEVGLWAETQLNMRDVYEKAIYEMAQAGKLGYSSGAIGVKREQVGNAYHIKTWSIVEASLTPTPAEPRNMVTLKSLIPAGGVADADTNPIVPVLLSEKEKKMSTPEEINAIDNAVTAALAKRDAEVKAIELKTAELKTANEAGYKRAVEEMNKKRFHMPRVAILPVGDDNDGVQAFKSWMQSGQENDSLIRPNASMLAIKGAGDAFNVTTTGSGGALVPDPLYNQIIAKRNLASWVRTAPCQYFSTDSDHLLIPRESTSHTAFVLTAESASYDENEGTVSQLDLALLKYTKMVQVTEEFLVGNNSNWETWFNNAMARAVGVTENTVATTAILAGSTAATAAASQTAITVPEIDAEIGSLGAGYMVNGEVGFLMKNSTKWYLKGIGATTIYAGWDFEGMPVHISDDMPARTTGLRSTLFGNFQMFAVLERPGILVQRNPYLHMATGEIDFFCNIYRAFASLQAEAFYTMAQA